MDKKSKIQFFKKQLASLQDMKAVAMQNYNLATRLESEANSALAVLGALPGQDRKVKKELPIETKLSLIGNLTK